MNNRRKKMGNTRNIQIQHLLKLNMNLLYIYYLTHHSNTTLVKVKSVDVLSINNDVYDSNTTLVKVKFCKFSTI